MSDTPPKPLRKSSIKGPVKTGFAPGRPKAKATPAAEAPAKPATKAPKPKAAETAVKAKTASKPKAPAKPKPSPGPKPSGEPIIAAELVPGPNGALTPEPVIPDPPPPAPEPAKKPNLGLRAVVDYAGPVAFLVAFLITRNILQATWALVAVSALALVLGFAIERRVAPMPLLTGGAALVFGVLTLFFHNPVILKMKPTFINLGLGSALLIGSKMGKNPLKLLMGEALHLSEAGWRRLTLRYGVFFLCVAALNEAVWRTQSDAVWVWFKMPGLPLLALLFSVTQVPGMLKDAKAAEIALKAAETQD